MGQQKETVDGQTAGKTDDSEKKYSNMAQLAFDAMDAMDAEKKRREEADAIDMESEVDGFMAACERTGKNPIEVVKKMVERTGEDPLETRKVHEFAKCVMKRIALALAGALCDKFGLSAISSILDFLASMEEEKREASASCRRDDDGDGDDEDDEDVDDGDDRPFAVKVYRCTFV